MAGDGRWSPSPAPRASWAAIWSAPWPSEAGNRPHPGPPRPIHPLWRGLESGRRRRLSDNAGALAASAPAPRWSSTCAGLIKARDPGGLSTRQPPTGPAPSPWRPRPPDAHSSWSPASPRANRSSPTTPPASARARRGAEVLGERPDRAPAGHLRSWRHARPSPCSNWPRKSPVLPVLSPATRIADDPCRDAAAKIVALLPNAAFGRPTSS
jgi:hypothetical protein